MKLEVGKYYKNNQGDTVEIIKNDGHDTYPFLDENGESYMANGKFIEHGDSPKDLIVCISPQTDNQDLTTVLHNIDKNLNRIADIMEKSHENFSIAIKLFVDDFNKRNR